MTPRVVLLIHSRRRLWHCLVPWVKCDIPRRLFFQLTTVQLSGSAWLLEYRTSGTNRESDGQAGSTLSHNPVRCLGDGRAESDFRALLIKSPPAGASPPQMQYFWIGADPGGTLARRYLLPNFARRAADFLWRSGSWLINCGRFGRFV